MGVYIFLDIMPNHIDKDEWEHVYEESLQLVHAYPFMDWVVDEKTYNTDWIYADRTMETELDRDYFTPPSMGWHILGDFHTMLAGESFFFMRDLEYYRRESKGSGNCNDILGSSIKWKTEWLDTSSSLHVNKSSVFDAKTQGYPYHIYLLAIACLIESRFPAHAMVTGDISIGQMKKAIDWANTILDKPIQLTERANNEKLLLRIKKLVHDDLVALDAFTRLTFHAFHFPFGELVRKHFTRETILGYYKKRFMQDDVGTFGFRSTLSEFVDQGHSLEDACNVCVLDPDGLKYDPMDFAKVVLSLDWKEQKHDPNESMPVMLNDPESDEPDTVSSQLGKVFLKMSGFQDSSKSNLTYQEVATILDNKLGHLCNIDSLVKKDDDFAKDAEADKEIEKFLREYEDRLFADKDPDGTDINYDVTLLEDLITWKKGQTIHPNIEGSIANMKDFIHAETDTSKEMLEYFQSLTEHQKIQYLIKNNQYFVIRKQTWLYFFQHIDEPDLINAFARMLSIDADELNRNKLCKALANNTDLFKTYLL